MHFSDTSSLYTRDSNGTTFHQQSQKKKCLSSFKDGNSTINAIVLVRSGPDTHSWDSSSCIKIMTVLELTLMDMKLIHYEDFCFSAEIFTEVLQRFCSNVVRA